MKSQRLPTYHFLYNHALKYRILLNLDLLSVSPAASEMILMKMLESHNSMV